ncbi:VapC toxin protein [Rhodovulum sp. PH10]|uniref:type II toxin-antitoxin system VapC family toxin n=1 Tax=Rhodovulum sp. PH10 TaxID=1187851 RepID=UPI00027C2361|nr:type II toxin-antitoxin system VapC family toxin [Rhodovulum sp. PH10]EJW11872.1 VapC toxin protein [Rhodovulum sp. PH10]
MSYLIDTNIVSEIRKGERCDPRVAAWWAGIDGTDLHLSVLVLGEIRKGIERARRTDPIRAEVFERWLAAVEEHFAGRILPIDRRVADEWGRMIAIRPVPTVDALLAASAKVHGMTLVTRNLRDVADLGASVLDPFDLPTPPESG